MANQSKNLLERALENMHHPFSSFTRAQKTSSVFLLLATLLALWWANSNYATAYLNLIHTELGFSIGVFELHASLKHIINDGLMVIFFFLLGLEIKREFLAGDLAQPQKRRMLMLCAVGGMVVPALIYLLFNWSLESQIGWGIPMATDTAFALGVLAIVRKQIPVRLLAFIVGLAIIDDIGAILVITIFYSQQINIIYLCLALISITYLALLNYAGIREPLFYLVAGVITWWMTLQSGVHPTIAGVAIAFTVPARPKLASSALLNKAKKVISGMLQKTKTVDVLGSKRDHEHVLDVRDFAERATTPLRRWEDALVRPVALFILPLFALTNAGVVLSVSSFIDSVMHPTGLGIIAGLVVGKFVGISGACWLGLRYKLGCLPEGMHLQHIVGVSFIAGIGFTMSTFIAALAFDAQPEHLHNAKTAILVASVISAMLGVLYFLIMAKKVKKT
ncbi:Na+/H+ antiporter NhaA [Rheinheimera sp. UJ63]|uniref:Na+/H+ antiporter NhaA n=1 Tax=Rheinheimera sp. UJ63 TaxID=2910157 RepID=UPI001F353B70|nr:Na+/H+ antiporter NhaA [Rheinheimera sp. UJ63]MCF4007856.1 Na+/H+ antiporter NhaA [Rheinheimera sp. UJ63]